MPALFSLFGSRRRPAPLLLLAALIGLFGLASARPAAATTYQVINLADDGSAGSLRSSITAANANAGSTITFSPGLSGTVLLGSPLPALAANVTIQGPGAAVLAVDGAGVYQPFAVTSGVTASLSGLTIQNGRPRTIAPYNGNGGGVYNGGTLTLTGCTLASNSATAGGGVSSTGTLTLIGCTLTGNRSLVAGGGIYFTGGTVTVTGCTLTANKNTYNSGAGIYNSAINGTLTLTDDILYGDTVNGSPAELAGALTATDCDIEGGLPSGSTDGGGNLNADPQFVSGTAPYDLHLQAGSPCLSSGGGLDPSATDHDGNLYADPSPSMGAFQYGFYTVTRLADDSSPGSLRAAITYANANANTVINFLPGLSGTILLGSALPALSASMSIDGPGASAVAVDGQNAVQPFSVNSGVTAFLSRLTVQNSYANYGGGVKNSGTLTLSGCTLAGNRAFASGGGFYNTGTLILSGCTLAGNSAPNGSGGVVSSYGTLTLTGCTLTNNSAKQGGGIINFGSLTLTDDILFGDTATQSGGEISGYGATVNYCDIQGGYAGTGNVSADPLLSALGNYGGPTQTFALLPGSPCFGKGTNAGLTADQRGVATPQSGRYDIGAFESRGFTVTPDANSTPQSTKVSTAFTNSLTATVTAVDPAHLEPVVGGTVAFTAPAQSGASATLSAATVTIPGGGTVSVTATANATAGGPYTVTAGTGAGSGAFALTNTVPNLTLTPATLPAATVGTAYSQTISAGNGTAPYTYAVTIGTLPAGLSLDTTGGVLSGTPTASGSFPFTITATDSNGVTGHQDYTLTVNPAASGTSLASSQNPSLAGQSVTFTATVAGSSPTGSVTFTVDGAAGTPVPLTSGAAALKTSALTVGRHTVTARYGGDANNTPSTSATLTQTVTNTSVTVTSASGTYGQSATLTASLHGIGSIALPGRTLTFLVDGAVVGTAVTGGTSVATLHLTLGTTYAPGAHVVTVSFAGDAAGTTPFHAASTGTGTLTVNPTGSSLTVPGLTGTRGQAVTLSARLTRTPDRSALSGACLTFFVDGGYAGNGFTDGTGQASLSYAVPGTLARGGHKITVSYGGAPAYGGCTGSGTLSVF